MHRLRSMVVLLSGLALLLGVQGVQATPFAQPTPSPQASLSAAATAERNGDYTTAEADYRALAGSTDPATAAAGNLALGRFLETNARSGEALAPLQAAVAALDGTPDGLRATFLLGEAQADQQQNQAAAASFQVYLTGGGPAAGYAALERAWALQAAGDDNGALSALAAPLQATSVTVRRAALLAASRSHERLGEFAQAAADQQGIVATQPSDGDLATALVEAARLDHLAGDDADAAKALTQVVATYPSVTAAGTALDQLDALGISVDPLQRGIVLFDLGRNDGATTAFQQILGANPSADLAAQATYYLARIADRENQNDAALTGYAAADALAPNGSVAPDAIWGRAELLRFLGRYRDAQDAYTSLVLRFPNSGNAADASFDAGLMAYLDGRASEAAAAWTAIAKSATGSDAARANLWLGKLALAAGDHAGAASDFAQAQALQPSGYYGLRAAVLADGAAVSLSGAAVAPPAEDWGSVETWLTAWVGPEDPSRFTALEATQDWTEGVELAKLGWSATPNTLIGDALTSVAQQPWTLYRAARMLTDLGRTTLALQAAEELLSLAGVQPGGPLDAPAALLRLAYPVDYVDLVNQDAGQNGLDPLLIDAVIRQESAFDPTAGSSAGAQGLLQLEPSTAQAEAGMLGLNGFTPAELKQPLINLQLGAGVLAQQAQTASSDFSQTLAGYNAGNANASRWAQRAGGDPDRFYEAIDFIETRLYIRLVSDNYAIYNLLYRGAAQPTLLPPRSAGS